MYYGNRRSLEKIRRIGGREGSNSMILSAQFRPRLMATLHVFAYAHGLNTHPRTTTTPSHPPSHEFRARTYFRVVCTFARRLNLPHPPTPTHHLLFTTPYLRVVTHVSVSPRDTERRFSLFRLIATNSAQTTSRALLLIPTY